MNRPLYSISSLIRLLRYRFFLFAGMFPFLLGQSIPPHFRMYYLIWGALGVFFVLGGVECFNEYFDAKMGTDRIFSDGNDRIPDVVLYTGVLFFALACGVGLFLSRALGMRVMLFAVTGFFAAAFYVAPPFRWAYLGLGELVITFSYGPLLVCGSYYLQAQKVDMRCAVFSVLAGLLIFPLSIVNEIPDYYQDKIVGKRNLVVRLGRRNAVYLYVCAYILFYILLTAGISAGMVSLQTIILFAAVPFIIRSVRCALQNYDTPDLFVKAIRHTIFIYLFGAGGLLVCNI